MGPCTRRSRSGRTAVASARCNWPGRAVAPLLPGCAANGSLIIKARCDVSWATTAYPAYDQLTAVMAPPECRAGQARCAADGFWREQVTAMRAMAYLNGTTACWPAGPGAWPHPASTRRRTHRTGGRGPSVPLFGGIGGAPALSAFHVPKQVTTTMRELSRGTHGRSACTALSAPGSVALIAEPRRSPWGNSHDWRDVHGRDGLSGQRRCGCKGGRRLSDPRNFAT